MVASREPPLALAIACLSARATECLLTSFIHSYPYVWRIGLPVGVCWMLRATGWWSLRLQTTQQHAARVKCNYANPKGQQPSQALNTISVTRTYLASPGPSYSNLILCRLQTPILLEAYPSSLPTRKLPTHERESKPTLTTCQSRSYRIARRECQVDPDWSRRPLNNKYRGKVDHKNTLTRPPVQRIVDRTCAQLETGYSSYGI